MSPENKHNAQSTDLLRIVVEEVDDAREVYELAQQLVKALPLRSFDDLSKAVGSHGNVTFRGQQFRIAQFQSLIPEILFPIDDVTKLVTLLHEAVRMAPPHIQYSEKDPVHARRRLRRLGILGAQIGALGRPRGAAEYGMRQTQAPEGQ